MWSLIRKFSPMFILFIGLYTVFLFPLLNYDRITGPDTENPIYIFYQGIYIIWVALGALWAHENQEHKTKAYRFLRTLPLKKIHVVGAKFALVFSSVVIFVAYQSVMILILTGNAELASATWSYMAVLGNLCLLIAALSYILIFRFGFVRFGKYLLMIWLLLYLSPILLREFIFPVFQISLEDVLKFVTGFHWLAVSICGVILFWGLLPLAARQSAPENG